MEVDLEWLQAVVARHTPAFFLHPAGEGGVLVRVGRGAGEGGAGCW